MSQIHQQPTEMALWHALVEDAQALCKHPLHTDETAYLVFLLMRYLQKPELAESCFALSYLDAQLSLGRQKSDKLQLVGDQCLLTSGFFPQRAKRKRVKISYFVELGQAAYLQLADSSIASMSRLYTDLAQHFVGLMDVLQALNKLSDAQPLLEPLDAVDLWVKTGSDQALSAVSQNPDGFVVTGVKTRQ